MFCWKHLSLLIVICLTVWLFIVFSIVQNYLNEESHLGKPECLDSLSSVPDSQIFLHLLSGNFKAESNIWHFFFFSKDLGRKTWNP